MNAQAKYFEVQRYHVSIRGREENDCSDCEATTQVVVGNSETSNTCLYVSEGDGPVNALDGALRKALVQDPWLNSVVLYDYHVHIVVENGVSSSASKTCVSITSKKGQITWEAVAVHENIVTASLMALAESFREAIRWFERVC